MKHIPFYSIPAVLFIMCCGLFLSFYPDKVAAQLALHHAWYSPSGYWWMEVITSWGEAHLFVIVIIAVILQKRYLMAFEFLSAGIVSSIVVQSLKRLVFAPSPRPMAVIKWSETLLPEGLEVPLQFAFPSGHTTTAFVFFYIAGSSFQKDFSSNFSRHSGNRSGTFSRLFNGTLDTGCHGWWGIRFGYSTACQSCIFSHKKKPPILAVSGS